MLVGYARVPKENGQDTVTQVAALKAAGVERLYEEHASGGRRPKLTERQRAEIIAVVTSGQKSESEAARLFGVHPSTVSRLMAAERQGV